MTEVLFLSPRWPSPPFDGGRIRIWETLRHVSSRHRVTFVSAVGPGDEESDLQTLQNMCDGVYTAVRQDRLPSVILRLMSGVLRGSSLVQSFFYDYRLAARVRELTERKSFDIIHVEFPVMAPYLRAVHPRTSSRTILSTHNIESIRFERETRISSWDRRRLLLLGDHLLFKKWETEAIRRFNGVTAVSEAEREWISQNAPGAKVELVPNGVDAQFFSYRAPRPSDKLTFVGSMDYPPNIDAVLWFSEAVFPNLRRQFPQLKFLVVGSRPDRRVLGLQQQPGVEVTGQVPDIRPYLKDSMALVVPLRSGGGTRLKILQAMALGCPVISSTIGAEGLDLSPGIHWLPADDPDQWFFQVSLLRSSSGLANYLAQSARQVIDSTYDWRCCLAGLDRLYLAVLNGES
jgi:polysaccharide biosynthesis protein PslH